VNSGTKSIALIFFVFFRVHLWTTEVLRVNYLLRLLFKFSVFVVLPLAILAFLLALATSAAPVVGQGGELSLADLERGKQVLESVGLANMREGQERRMALSRQDLNSGLNYLAWRMGRGGADVVMAPDRMRVRASVRLPGLPVPRYFNLELVLVQAGNQLAPAGLRLGTLPLPTALSGHLLGWVLALSPAAPQYVVVRDMLRSAQLGKDNLVLTFVWRGDALERAMENSLGLDEDAVNAYRKKLASLPGRDLAPLLGQLFSLAKERSAKKDPVTENRAALAVLAEAALGRRLVSARGTAPALRKGGLRLGGRADFAQHFALSAFLAATGGEGLSDLAGLYKELQDAREGSGFSFNDLAADRAGSRLGEAGTRSTKQARRVQALLAGGKDAGTFFPRVHDLPEFVQQAEFERRFGGVGAPAYKAMVAKIEARIAALPLYQ
jgi:hypothetical protein